MDVIWLWVFISVVLSAIAALIVVHLGSRRAADSKDETCDEGGNSDMDGVDGFGNDDDKESGAQKSRHLILVICVFSVIIFVVTWLIMALCDERVQF